MTDEKQTETAEQTEAVENGNASHNGCGHKHRGECWPRHWQGKPRWKIFASIALITFIGFTMGRCSANHHDYHQFGHGYYQQQMQSDARANRSESLSVILDGIEATPEQRSKAVQLFR